LRRDTLDACFGLFRQSYFRYAYRLQDLGRFYVAYDRLIQHWRALLGDRLIEVQYEDLTEAPEAKLTAFCEQLGLVVEPACFAFHHNVNATNTASAIQVREPMHRRSAGKWRHFASRLAPLIETLEGSSIAVPHSP
jgi:hypothetical protein